jgi:hypothetical protein
MSSDDQFTALGPAFVGFQTNGANIQKGAVVAGTELGVQGTGPVGVLGQGQGGPGGEFASNGDLVAQVRVQPHPMDVPDAMAPAQPQEFVRITSLPVLGTAGDFFLGAFEITQRGGSRTSSCALWLCVTTAGRQGAPAAQWCQVLLGNPVAGQATDL